MPEKVLIKCPVCFEGNRVEKRLDYSGYLCGHCEESLEGADEVKKTTCPICDYKSYAKAPAWVECPDCEIEYWADKKGDCQTTDFTCPKCFNEWEDFLVGFPTCPACGEDSEVDESGNAIIEGDEQDVSPYDDFDAGDSTEENTESRVLKLIEDFGVTSDYQQLELSEEAIVEETIPAEVYLLNNEKFFKKANKDLYRLNPYRLLGLNVQARETDIRRETEKLKLQQKLKGKIKSLGKFLPVIPPPPPESLQEAIQELNDPEFKIFHGLFWFFPENSSEHENQNLGNLFDGDIVTAIAAWEKDVESGNSTKSIHHLAIANHLLALEGSNNGGGEHTKAEQTNWNKAFFFWKLLLGKDEFWGALSERIHAYGDPRVGPELSNEFRKYIPLFLSVQVAQLVLDSLLNDDSKTISFYFELIESTFSNEHKDYALKVVCDSYLKNTTALCENAVQKSKETPKRANKTFDELIREANKIVLLIDAITSEGSSIQNIVHDKIVTAGNNCAGIYANETEDWAGTLKLLEKLLPFAKRKDEKDKIQEAILVVSNNADMHLLDELVTISTGIIEQLRSSRSTFIEVQQCSDKITTKMLPLLKKIGEEKGTDSKLYQEATTIYCGTIQNLSIAINNYHKNYVLALKWLKHAQSLVKDPELAASLDEGISVVGNNARQAGNDGLYRGDFPTGPGLSWVVENNIMERHGVKIVLGIAGSIFLLILFSLFNYESNRPGYRNNPPTNQYSSPSQTSKPKTPTIIPTRVLNAQRLNTITDRSEVKKAQMALNILGYNCGFPDGIWGQRSKSALISFSEGSEGALNKSLQRSLLDRAESTYTMKVEALDREINSVENNLTRLKIEIDSYERRINYLSDYEMDAANSKIREYNSYVKKQRSLVDKYNNLIEEVKFVYDIKS